VSVVNNSYVSVVGEEKSHYTWKLFIGEKDTCKIILLGILLFKFIFKTKYDFFYLFYLSFQT